MLLLGVLNISEDIVWSVLHMLEDIIVLHMSEDEVLLRSS
jgi:hypothetical protein